MGDNKYSFNSRSGKTDFLRSKTTTDDVFEQNKMGTLHESMDPSKAIIREARDSTANPLTVPIILELDVTGSMDDIPENLIRTGLPKLISKLKKKGIAYPSVLVIAVDDSRVTRANRGPFQVGQFENGDKEMDMWFERMYLVGNGGGNGAESYNWAYYFANNHVVTDAWEKRKQKGFIFSIGDDNCQASLSATELQEIMKDNNKGGAEGLDTEAMVKTAQEKWHIHHIELGGHERSWKALLGNENVHTMGRKDYDGMAEKIADIVSSQVDAKDFSLAAQEEEEATQVTLEPTKTKITL